MLPRIVVLLALGAPGALGLPPIVDETGARHLAETLDGPPAATARHTTMSFDDCLRTHCTPSSQSQVVMCIM